MSTTRERIKNVFICLLLVGMLYLTYTVWFFDSPFETVGTDNLFGIDMSFNTSGEGEGTDLDAFGIRPMSIYVKGDGFSRASVYESERTDAIYKSLRPLLARVFDFHGDMKAADAKVWEEKLSGNGVLLDYFGNVPTGAICTWLGADVEDNLYSGRYYLLSADERNVKLYVKNPNEDEVYSVNTSVSSEELMSIAAGVNAVDAVLAGNSEVKDFEAINRETVIASASSKPAVISAYNTYATFSASVTDGCLAAFSLGDVSPGTYSEADGTQVYIADMVTMKISPAGLVSYTDPREEADETIGITVEHKGERALLFEKTEAARKIAATLASKLPGAGSIYLISALENGNEAEVIFGRHINGIPVDMNSGTYFMRVSFRGEMISDVRANLRGYDITSQSADVLNLRLVAAAVSGMGKKGDVSLRYADGGNATLSPSWFILSEKENENELVES